MLKTKSGFTIVELLIVIVVIAILAAISVVAFNGIQARAQNTNRLTELNAWSKLFALYKGTYGSYPRPDATTYGQHKYGFCLGIGYPGQTNATTGAGGMCHDNTAPVNLALNTELKKVSSLPSGIRTPTKSGALGVYADYWGVSSTPGTTAVEDAGNFIYTNTIELVQIFDGDAACPSPTYQKYAYPSGSATISRMCAIRLDE